MTNINLNLRDILSYLVEGKIVPSDLLPTNDVPFSSEILNKTMHEGNELHYEFLTDELYVFASDGSKIVCPDLSEGLSETSEWISNYLPDVFIDTDQGGNLRKADEADSCYKLFAIGYVLSDFRPEIKVLFDNYDYESMSSNGRPLSQNFKVALQKFQNLNSNRINAIISAAAYKLSIFKEKNESFYTGQLSQEETSELATLSRNIKAVISRYEREANLNPVGMKGMTKVRKLQLIDSRDVEIEALVNKTNVSMLYKISKLTSERIPPVIKSKIINEAERAGSEYVRRHSLEGLEAADAEQKVKRTVIRESYRAVLKSIKAKEIEKYKADKDKYVFKRKS